jgi:hypothetical protein
VAAAPDARGGDVDRFSEVSHQGWFSRIVESIKGVLVGLLLLVLSAGLLFWNEGNSVKTARTLDEGLGACVDAAADTVDPANEGKLVHVSGQATTTDRPADADLGVAAPEPALALVRTVEMYQWQEKTRARSSKRVGGGQDTTTDYEYSTVWSEGAISSSGFKVQAGHQNPPAMPLTSARFAASAVTLGAFTLPDALAARVDVRTPYAPASASPAAIGGRAPRAVQGGLYVGGDPAKPTVGDLRIHYDLVKPQPVSLVAQQAGASFTSYVASTGRELTLVMAGALTKEQMFAEAQRQNATLTWGLRAFGALLMALGFGLIFRPLSVVADVVPLIGDIVGFGTGLAALVMAACGSLLVIGVAWLFYRPLIGVPLVVGSVGLLVVAKVKGATRRARG